MKALIFGYIQKFVLSPPELYSPDTKVEKLGLTQSIIPINYYIISKNFENSKNLTSFPRTVKVPRKIFRAIFYQFMFSLYNVQFSSNTNF